MLGLIVLGVCLIGGQGSPIMVSPVGNYYPGMKSTIGGPLYTGYLAGPQPYVSSGLQSAGSGGYYDGGRIGGNYYDNDALKHTVQDVQHSAALGALATTGNHRVLAGTSGGQGYQHGSAGDVAQSDGTLYAGGEQEHDVVANDGYGVAGGSGLNKGHKTTGFHKSYHNVEEGKDSKYVDEDHKYAQDNFGKNYADLYGDQGVQGYGKSQGGGGYQAVGGGTAGAHSALDSVGLHDTQFGQHGNNGLYNQQLLDARSGRQGGYLNSGLAAGGRLHGQATDVGAYSRPAYYY